MADVRERAGRISRSGGDVVGGAGSGSRHRVPVYRGPHIYPCWYGSTVDSRLLASASNNATAPSEVAGQIVKVVDTLKGSCPFRVFVDPADDGAEDVFRMGDRVR